MLSHLSHDLLERLHQVYGAGAGAQEARYAAALAEFGRRFGLGPAQLFRAPGRVNLIGEHTDYNHGYVMPAALDRDVLVLVRPRADRRVRLVNMEREYGDREFAISHDIDPAQAGDWSNYARGAVQEAARLTDGLTGFDMLVSGAEPFGVPRGAGVSSSSALTVAIMVALSQMTGQSWDGQKMAALCSDAEWYVGTRGGIMDQFIALLATQGHALFLDCRPQQASFTSQSLPLPQGYLLVVVDSHMPHTNVRNAFNQRVAACRAGVAILGRTFPHVTHLRDVEGIGWADLEPLLPIETTLQELQTHSHALGDLPWVAPEAPLRVRDCCRHVWSENHRVLAARQALLDADVPSLARSINAAHASARDDYRISTPEIDLLVDTALSLEGCVAARLTGAGWGGCVIALVHQEAADSFLRQLPAQYAEQTGTEATPFPFTPGQGASKVGEFSIADAG